MEKPKYQQLSKENEKGERMFVGFKRTVVEYLPAGADEWQLEPFDHTPELSINLAEPAMGIENLKRPRTLKGL